jgi:hypothetical protein
LWDELSREHAEARTQSLRNQRLLDWSVLKVRPVAVVMSDDGVDVSCVVFHDECPGQGATLCCGELLLLLLSSSSSYDQKVACSDHVEVTNMGGGGKSMCGGVGASVGARGRTAMWAFPYNLMYI